MPKPGATQPIKTDKKQTTSLLRKRLDEINAQGERELAAVKAAIERVKASFQSQQ
jgi:hypothetical protein